MKGAAEGCGREFINICSLSPHVALFPDSHATFSSSLQGLKRAKLMVGGNCALPPHNWFTEAGEWVCVGGLCTIEGGEENEMSVMEDKQAWRNG